MYNPVQLNAEYSTAITDKGLWPNLKILPDGNIGAFIYNRPSHGFDCGDVELYVSKDAGKSWQFRSQVSDHSDNPSQIRMNHAVGINSAGHIVAIVSGWSEGRQAPILKPQICISKDNGLSWERNIWFPSDEDCDFIPYGDIVLDDEGNLTVGLNTTRHTSGESNFYISRSLDNGNNWENPEYVHPNHGEVTLLKTRSNKWFAVGRDVSRLNSYCNQIAAPDPLSLFTSSDGREWEKKKRSLTLPGQIPGHLLELSDGRLLVTYGCRIIGLCGVQVITSDDDGETWSFPTILISYKGPSDCGYPSTVELENGTLLTAFYAGDYPDSPLGGLPTYPDYHMGTLHWSTDILTGSKKTLKDKMLKG